MVEIDLVPEAENAMLECNARLITRAINTLVQNSIKNNPGGCEIRLDLENTNDGLMLSVADNGTGLSPEKRQELEEKPHYMESITASSILCITSDPCRIFMRITSIFSMFLTSSFLQIPSHDGHPCFRLYPSHYRADSGL